MGRDFANDTTTPVYVELAPCTAHRHLVDHLFILRDCGRLTGPGRSIYASPFCEVAVIGLMGGADIAWQTVQAQPRFGHRPRSSSLDGWMIGYRFDPLLASRDCWRSAMEDLTVDLDRIIRGSEGLDAVVGRLDRALDGMARAMPPLDRALSTVAVDPMAPIVRLADAAGVTPRTLQRRVRARSGLPPKRYTALRRFNTALREVAGEDACFADLAIAAGYTDQSHMTGEVARHTGATPGRLRAFARRQDRDEAVRFFQDANVLKRIRLFIHAPMDEGDPVDGGVCADQSR
jgi:AraC-like DNA-binding protein